MWASYRAQNSVVGLFFWVVFFSFTILGGRGDVGATEYLVTPTPDYDTTPTLGQDTTGPIIVYTSRPPTPSGFGPGSIYYRRLSIEGEPIGDPVLVSTGGTDDQLNDTGGSRIVYTAFNSTTTSAGTIYLYDIPTATRSALASATSIREARVYGDFVAWIQGNAGATELMLLDLRLGAGASPTLLAGPTPPATNVEIGDHFVVWDVYTTPQREVYAFDLATGQTRAVANDPAIDERFPSTSGPWVVFESRPTSGSIIHVEAKNLDTGERRTVVNNGSQNLSPTIDDDLIAYESRISGNYDIYGYCLSTGKTNRITSDSNDQRLNNVFGNMIAYVDTRSGDLDVYVSPLFPPLAEAGANQTGTINTPKVLDGSGSTDTFGLPLTYSWTIVSAPVGSAASLTGADTAAPSFTPDQYGNYVFQLIVTNSHGISSDPDTVTVQVPFIASHPIEFLSLTADPSTGPAPLDVNFLLVARDIDIDLRNAEIDFGDGTTKPVIMTGAGSPAYYGGAAYHTYTTSGDYTVTATVYDSSTSATKTVIVSVGQSNLRPVADAGVNQTVHPGTTVTLDGSGSTDPDGDRLVDYKWDVVSYPAGTAIPLSFTGMMPTFTPDLPGAYLLSLVVQDEHAAWSLPGMVTISTANTPPVADAGDDQAVTLVGITVNLNGSTSYDLDGDPIVYEWAIVGLPSGSGATLSGGTSATPSFVPDVYGDFLIQLVVRDSWSTSASDTVTVSFANIKPVANAGVNQAVQVPASVQLDGSRSSDANNDVLAFSWSIVTKPPGSGAQLSNQMAVTPGFVADLPGAYVVSLTVDDGIAVSDPSTVTIAGTASSGVIIDRIRDGMDAINGLDPGVLKNPTMKNTLTNKINAAISDLDAGRYPDALDKLQNDILAKTDGCAVDGAPDKNDWLKDCSSQAQVYPILVDAINYLKDMLGLP